MAPRHARRLACILAGPLLLACPGTAHAQANLQLWGNVVLGWVKSDRLAYEVDVEPKVLLAAPEGEPGWRNLDVTPNVEFSPRGWYDVVVDTTVGTTHQTDDITSTEVTPRLGVRLHLFSRKIQHRLNERVPGRRIVVRDLVRVESRNFFYGGAATGSDSSVRFRNRLEMLMPLNRDNLGDDGARYLMADWEWFIPLDAHEERFANKQRIRAGLGWRKSFHWRFEAIYLWTRSRDTIDDGFNTSDNAIDIRIKKFF